MQSLTRATSSAREYRAIVPCDGYVHKFRLEAREEAAAERRPHAGSTPAVNFGSLLAKFVLSVLLFSLVASLALAQSNDAPAEVRKDVAKTPVLTRAQFDQLLAHPEQLLIIDIRRPDEVTAIGGLPVYLSVQIAALENSLAWIPKDRKIVTVSNHAGRAGRAGDLLAAKGFKVVGRIGVQNYEQEGGKVTRILSPVSAADQKNARTTTQH